METKIGTISISSLEGGWINDFAKGNASTPQTKPNTYVQGILNMNKPNYLGQISSTFGENPNTMSATELAMNAAVSKAGKGYFILRGGIIKEVDLTASWAPASNNYTAPAGTTTDQYKDIWKHVSGDTNIPAYVGAESMFFTYQTASNAYCNYFPTATPATRGSGGQFPFQFTYTSVPHVGVKSVNNQSYVTDGNYLRAYDPLTNAWTSINVGLGTTLVSVADYGNYVAAVGGDGTNSWLFLWTGTAATVPNYKYEIRDTNVTAIVNEGGDLRVFTYGKNGTTKIKTFSGNGFSEEGDFETPTSLCSSPIHGQVDVWLNQIVWKGYQSISGVVTDGYIWTYGSVRKNEVLTGAHRVGKVTTTNTTTTDTVGCVKNLYTDNLYIGIKDTTSTYKIYNVKADTSYASTATSNLKTALYPLPRNSTIERIQFYFSDYTVPGTSASGSSLTCSLYADYNYTTDLLNFSIPINDTTGSSTIYYYPIVKSIPNLDTFYMNINFTFCTIKKIDITYSYMEGDI